MDEQRVAMVMERYEGSQAAWLADAYAVAFDVCRQHDEVTADLLWSRLAFPPSPADGRVFGKVIRVALARGWLEKAKNPDGTWKAWDHLDRPPVFSRDKVKIRQKALIPVYRSLVVEDDTASVVSPARIEHSAPPDPAGR